MPPLTRRQFLGTTAAVALAGPAAAIDPVKRPPGQPQLKLSLAAYSFRQALDLKKPTMTLLTAIPIEYKLAPAQGVTHAEDRLAF
jgi:hypothetical protein